jgi:hypothetical protein
VDRGAGENVNIVLMKKDGEKVVEKAETFSARLLDKLGVSKAGDALRKSITSILGDKDVINKGEALDTSVQQFVDYVTKTAPGAIAATVLAANPGGDIEKEDTVSKELTDQVAKLGTDLAAATLLITKQADQLALLSMSDLEKAYVAKNNLSEADALAFAKLDDVAKKAKMTPPASGNDDDEDDSPAMKKLRGENDEMKKRVVDLELRDSISKFAKRAVELGMPEAQGEVLRKAHSGDVSAIGELEGLLKAANAQIAEGGLFSEFGSKISKGGGTAMTALTAKADELRKSDPKLTAEGAFSKAYVDPANAALVKQYKSEQGLPA